MSDRISKEDYNRQLGLTLARNLECYSDDYQTGYVNPETDYGEIRLDLSVDAERLGRMVSEAFTEMHKTRLL